MTCLVEEFGHVVNCTFESARVPKTTIGVCRVILGVHVYMYTQYFKVREE